MDNDENRAVAKSATTETPMEAELNAWKQACANLEENVSKPEDVEGWLVAYGDVLACFPEDYRKAGYGQSPLELIGRLVDERDEVKSELAQAKAEVARLREIGQRGCECSPKDACLFAKERDEALREIEHLRKEIKWLAENGWEYCTESLASHCRAFHDHPAKRAELQVLNSDLARFAAARKEASNG